MFFHNIYYNQYFLFWDLFQTTKLHQQFKFKFHYQNIQELINILITFSYFKAFLLILTFIIININFFTSINLLYFRNKYLNLHLFISHQYALIGKMINLIQLLFGNYRHLINYFLLFYTLNTFSLKFFFYHLLLFFIFLI